MILVYTQLWQRLIDYGLKSQVGIDVVDQFNTRLAEVQYEVFNDLSCYYQQNEKIRDLFAPWVIKDSGTPTSGQIILPNGAARVISLAVTASGVISYEINPITEGELVMAYRVPQRKPDLSKKRVYYYNEDPLLITLAPQVSVPYLIFYLIYPTEAKIAFEYSQTSGEDIMSYDAANTVDLEWTESATNIILYKMLEKYGISAREQWLAEYAKMGIVSSTQPEPVQ